MTNPRKVGLLSQTAAGVEAAHVLALDDQATAITDIAISDASGNYTLDLPIARDDMGAPVKEVTEAPVLRWSDDSSEDFYTVVVYNAYCDLVWCLSDQSMGCDGPNIPAMSGVAEVAVPYGGPMEPGMYYQFRATSWRTPGGMPGPISTTEDLRGVFYVDVKP